MKSVTYSKASLKTLRRMPANTAKTVTDKIALYASDPAALANNVIALRGSPLIRLRVGDWRVIMSDDDVVLDVVKIAPRSGAYD